MIELEPVRGIRVSCLIPAPVSPYWIAGIVRALPWAIVFSVASLVGFGLIRIA